MKKLIALILAIVMMIALVACGTNENPGNNNGDTPSTQNTESNSASENTTANNNNDTFEGEVTEEVVRNYKVADENDFSYDENAEGVRITKYVGTDTIVVIPDTIGGNKVVSIAAVVFGNDSNVRGVFVPSGVKELEATFGNNDDLEVVIWEGAEIIGPNTFNNCPSLHTVILGENLISIGENAFAVCSSLEELYIPASVQSLDSSIAATIFFWCEKLTITGEAGSYIETFCTEYGIQFKAK